MQTLYPRLPFHFIYKNPDRKDQCPTAQFSCGQGQGTKCVAIGKLVCDNRGIGMIGPFSLIEKIGMVIRHAYSFQYLHTLVENVSQRHHRKYLEDSGLLLNASYKRSHYIMTIINEETARIALPKEEEPMCSLIGPHVQAVLKSI